MRSNSKRNSLTYLFVVLVSTCSFSFGQVSDTLDLYLEQVLERAQKGDMRAQWELGVHFFYGFPPYRQDFREAAKWYRAAAEQGDAEAQAELGMMYAKGIGLVQNHQEAYRWSRLAASAGQSSSQYNLGVLYENGLGVRRDYARAYIWFSIAASASYSTCGLPGSQLNSDSTGLVDCTTAAQARDRIILMLNSEEQEIAQAQATRCFDSNFKDCGE